MRALIDQERARVIIRPTRSSEGFWFGAGNVVEHDGTLYLVGRYRSYGDSRTGLGSGERGFELTLFRSTNGGGTFDRVWSLDKKALSHHGLNVLSIEGSHLIQRGGGFSLFVSTEKEIPYPEDLQEFSKPGTGIWTIDELTGADPETIPADSIHEVHRSNDPAYLHVKDPFVHRFEDGREALLFCTHPYCWSSSNTGYMLNSNGSFAPPVYRFFERGPAWDVAIARGTSILPLPRTGILADAEPLSILFYDGGECLRRHEEHASGVSRARGYSCEELGGAALVIGDSLDRIERLSRLRPSFVSPTGTGSSRYVDVLATSEGYYATWQQSQYDRSQALVMNFLSHEEAEAIFAPANHPDDARDTANSSTDSRVE